jgi:ring-1,2-phenylacetyl-CoA epoxidase subunit PaaE
MTTVIRTPRRRPAFHPLTVRAVRELTEDAVVVTFAVPDELRETFEFRPGQHLTIRHVDTDGSELRRSYSLCSTPDDLRRHGTVRIGIRLVSDGRFSGHAVRGLRPGDTLEVLPPLGHFTTTLDPARRWHYAAIVAGSGITPVLSLLTAALWEEPASRFTLIFGNRTAASVMFAEELADLKDRHPGRLHLVHALSREPMLSTLLSGRLDAPRLEAIFEGGLVDTSTVDEWFLCGPYGMVMDAKAVLAKRGVPDPSVHTELFHVDSDRGPVTAVVAPTTSTEPTTLAGTTMAVILDGRESTVTIRRDERVLDAALRVRGELPYACKGGVCSTCRARLVEGEVSMANNYVLETDELAAGYILTCQASPLSARLVVDYDS